MPSDSPHVDILVPNWNGEKHLRDLLPNVFQTTYPDFTVYLLDDASTDASVDFVQREFPQVAVRRNTGNLGYVGNCNDGFRSAMRRKTAYIALVTTDVLLDERWLKHAVNAFESDRYTGLVGFDVLNYPLPSDYDAFLSEKAGRTEIAAEPVDAVPGCVMVLRTQVLEGIGLFDPAYRMYAEENDLAARIRRAGLKVLKLSVPVYHGTEGSSTRSTSLARSYWAIRNTFRYAIKNESPYRAVRYILHAVNVGCNPFKKVDTNAPPMRRLRPRSAPVNWCLHAAALGWNLVFLPFTLRRRLADNARADQYVPPDV